MKSYDMPLKELKEYRPELTKNPDFEEFWQQALAHRAGKQLQVTMEEYPYPIDQVRVYRVIYQGEQETPIHGWYIVPANAGPENQVPGLVHYHGYKSHKGYIQEFLKWSIQGIAVLSIDIRGQGGESPDYARYDNGSVAGWMTKGIDNPLAYYYRHVYLDCMGAVDFIESRPEIDASRIGVFGESQGGGISLAVAGLDRRVRLCMSDYPFLTHFEHAVEKYEQGPYGELFEYFRRFDPEMKKEESIFGTLSYFDSMNHASNVNCPTLISVCLDDRVCPPSTVFAAFHHVKGDKELAVYPHFQHESLPFHEEKRIQFVQRYFFRQDDQER